MRVKEVLVRKASGIAPPDLELIVILEGDRFEAISIQLSQPAGLLAYSLIDLAGRLFRK